MNHNKQILYFLLVAYFGKSHDTLHQYTTACYFLYMLYNVLYILNAYSALKIEFFFSAKVSKVF